MKSHLGSMYPPDKDVVTIGYLVLHLQFRKVAKREIGEKGPRKMRKARISRMCNTLLAISGKYRRQLIF